MTLLIEEKVKKLTTYLKNLKIVKIIVDSHLKIKLLIVYWLCVAIILILFFQSVYK